MAQTPRKLKLEICTDNAAFYPDESLELARILREAANKLESGATESPLFDFNGNRVGGFKLQGKRL